MNKLQKNNVESAKISVQPALNEFLQGQVMYKRRHVIW